MHDQPFKNTPYTEDVGRMGRTYTFTAFVDERTVQGQDYFQTRDELIEAIENDPSVGTLVLPTLGKRRVRPQSCSVSFSNSVGGMESLELTFVEAGEELFPEVTINTQETAQEKSTETQTAVIEEAGTKTNFAPVSPDSGEGLNDPDVNIEETVQIPETFNNEIAIVISSVQQNGEELDEFVRIFSDYQEGLKDSMSDPTLFFENTNTMLAELRDVWPSENLDDAYNAFNSIFGANVDNIGKIVNLNTVQRLLQDDNNQAVRDGYRNLLLSQMANITVQQDYESSNAVQDRKISILEAFGQQIENASINRDAAQRNALVDLRSSTLDHLDGQNGQLPDEVDLSIGDTVPVWAVANEVYGDSFRGEEIASSNGIVNPNFIQGQSVVKVLTS